MKFKLQSFQPNQTELQAEINILPNQLSLSFMGMFDWFQEFSKNDNYEREDELWTGNCLELFLRKKDSSEYYEFNLSPRNQWNLYHFDDYRAGMKVSHDFAIKHIMGNNFFVHFDFSGDFSKIDSYQISAVSNNNFWGIEIDKEKPDFHHPKFFQSLS